MDNWDGLRGRDRLRNQGREILTSIPGCALIVFPCQRDVFIFLGVVLQEHSCQGGVTSSGTTEVLGISVL